MVEMPNLDPSKLELVIQRELAYRQKVSCPKNEVVKTLSRSPSFNDWTITDSIANGSPKGYLGLQQKPSPPKVSPFSGIPGLPTSFPTTQNQIKTEPYSGEEVSGDKALLSAAQDWIGPINSLFDTKSQSTHQNSSYQLPPLAPVTREIATGSATATPHPKPDLIPRTNTIRKPSLFPGPSVPTKSRSALKRKEIAPEVRLNPSPSSANSKMITRSDLVCELCQVSCSGRLTMQQHLRGRSHKAKLVWKRQKQSCPGERTNNRQPPRCDVCQIWCSDWGAMEMHLKGRKHKARMQEAENGGGSIVAKKPVRCELCLVNCMNEDLFKVHLKGRQHATRQEMKRRGMI